MILNTFLTLIILALGPFLQSHWICTWCKSISIPVVFVVLIHFVVDILHNTRQERKASGRKE